MDRCCRRCGCCLTQPGVLIEVTHYRAGGHPTRDATLLCRECAESRITYMQARPEVLDANRLVTISR